MRNLNEQMKKIFQQNYPNPSNVVFPFLLLLNPPPTKSNSSSVPLLNQTTKKKRIAVTEMTTELLL